MIEDALPLYDEDGNLISENHMNDEDMGENIEEVKGGTK